jgi:hypothetical protein
MFLRALDNYDKALDTPKDMNSPAGVWAPEEIRMAKAIALTATSRCSHRQAPTSSNGRNHERPSITKSHPISAYECLSAIWLPTCA